MGTRGRVQGSKGRAHFRCVVCGERTYQYGTPQHMEGVEGPRVYRWRRCRACGARLRTAEVIIHSNEETVVAGRVLRIMKEALETITKEDE